MNQKRNFPLYLIDRSKPEAFPFDYITCFDTIAGFVARVVHFKDNNTFNAFVSMYSEVPDNENVCITQKFRTGGIAIVVEDFLFDMEFSETNNSRVQRLLKKALKKYIFAEVSRTPHGELSIDNQIKQQQLTVDKAKSQYNALVARSSIAEADYNIQLAEATLQTLQRYRDNQKYFITVNN